MPKAHSERNGKRPTTTPATPPGVAPWTPGSAARDWSPSPASRNRHPFSPLKNAHKLVGSTAAPCTCEIVGYEFSSDESRRVIRNFLEEQVILKKLAKGKDLLDLFSGDIDDIASSLGMDTEELVSIIFEGGLSRLIEMNRIADQAQDVWLWVTIDCACDDDSNRVTGKFGRFKREWGEGAHDDTWHVASANHRDARPWGGLPDVNLDGTTYVESAAAILCKRTCPKCESSYEKSFSDE